MEKEKYSEKIATLIQDYLDKYDWHYSFDRERGVIRFNLRVSTILKKLLYHICVYENTYLVYVYPPIGAKSDNPEQMKRMADYICRINSAVANGNFELNMRDGEISYKVFVDCDGDSVPSENILRNSIYSPALMFERYGSGLANIIFASADPADEIKKIENPE